MDLQADTSRESPLLSILLAPAPGGRAAPGLAVSAC